uniref:Mitochondrial inner membrane protein Mpv17 n=1 Tax=Cuerna arida TaxID=1464854 RepID=A0A1B6EVZ7_9HEMI
MAFRKLFISYGNLLRLYPVTMQATQTGIIMGSADIIAQTLIEKRNFNGIEWNRCARYASIGLLIGPTVGIWYRVLEYQFGSGGVKVLFKKIACDQLIFAPIFLGCLMFTIDTLKGTPMQEIREDLKHNYPEVLLSNYKVWPFVQVINFYFVPLHFRVLFVQMISVMWNTYLSWKINSNKLTKQTQKEINIDKKSN